MLIRTAVPGDHDAIWAILQPMIAEGETYTFPRDIGQAETIAYWTSPAHQCFVAEDEGRVVGTYFLRPNQHGGGSHVANCGYVTASRARGRGVARAMATHSLQQARDSGFRAIQFNFVISTNERAVRLWQSLGFEIVGRLPDAFLHPRLGYTDALVMFQTLAK
jgi:ribosomal protein S18 acetylase RimI-like enzyme